MRNFICDTSFAFIENGSWNLVVSNQKVDPRAIKDITFRKSMGLSIVTFNIMKGRSRREYSLLTLMSCDSVSDGLHPL